MNRTLTLFALCLAIAAPPLHAGVNWLGSRVTDNTSALTGYVTNDFAIRFTGQLGVQQLYVRLHEGEIYHTPSIGGDTPPHSAFVGLVPELAFDTFVANGGLTAETSSSVQAYRGAVNLEAAFYDMSSPDRLSIAWSPGLGPPPSRTKPTTLSRD